MCTDGVMQGVSAYKATRLAVIGCQIKGPGARADRFGHDLTPHPIHLSKEEEEFYIFFKSNPIRQDLVTARPLNHY